VKVESHSQQTSLPIRPQFRSLSLGSDAIIASGMQYDERQTDL